MEGGSTRRGRWLSNARTPALSTVAMTTCPRPHVAGGPSIPTRSTTTGSWRYPQLFLNDIDLNHTPLIFLDLDSYFRSGSWLVLPFIPTCFFGRVRSGKSLGGWGPVYLDLTCDYLVFVRIVGLMVDVWCAFINYWFVVVLCVVLCRWTGGGDTMLPSCSMRWTWAAKH
jgi:hypothetical protein